MHQTGLCQSSYGAQFRINVKKGKSRLWLIVGHTAIQRIPGTSPFVSYKSPLPLYGVHEHDIDRISLLVLCVSVPIKDNERIGFPMNRISAEEKGNSCRSGVICPEILPFSIEQDLLTVLQDKARSFELQAFGIVYQYSC